MRHVFLFILVCISLASCVTKAKYAQVVSSAKSKEKQQLKLEQQLEALKENNRRLRDSAERLSE